MEGVFFISFYETMLLQQKQLQQKLTDSSKTVTTASRRETDLHQMW